MSCCSCAGPVTQILDLGDHYLPDFTDPGEPRGKPWPLNLVMCVTCSLLQLSDLTPRDALYHARYGFRSGVNEAIRADLADVVMYALRFAPAPRNWLDIACNDGTLLGAVPASIDTTGIDPLCMFESFRQPAKARAKWVIGDYFDPDYFKRGEFDVITSVSMFYDLADPGRFVDGVTRVLAPDGIWVIQQNYALDMLRRNAVDNICHEHVTYFSVRSLQHLLERHGLQIIDVGYSDVNGGCVRTAVCRQGERQVTNMVALALDEERRALLHDAHTVRNWGREVGFELGKTRLFLEDAKAQGKRVYVYGASTRGGTILQMIGAGPDLLPYAVERQHAKVGKIMAATGIPIISEDEMRADPPDYLLIGPWFFRDIFLDRERVFLATGGAMIFPLPSFEVVTG